jgi:hypothetical protein
VRKPDDKIRRLKLNAVTLDKKNANLGTKRGRKFIAASLEEYGLGRSILLDRDRNVISGNKTIEAFRKRGGTELIVVGTRGDALVAVQRLDLDIDSKKGRGLAIADNRANELDLSWGVDVLESFKIDLSGFWNPKEFAAMYGPSPDAAVEPRTSEVVVVIHSTKEQLENQMMATLNAWSKSGIQIDIS